MLLFLCTACSKHKKIPRQQLNSMKRELATNIEVVVPVAITYQLHLTGIDCTECARVVLAQLQTIQGMQQVAYADPETEENKGLVVCQWQGQEPLNIQSLHDLMEFHGFGLCSVQGSFTGSFYKQNAGYQVGKLQGCDQELLVSAAVNSVEPFLPEQWTVVQNTNAPYQATVWFNEVTDSFWVTPHITNLCLPQTPQVEGTCFCQQKTETKQPVHSESQLA